MILSLTSFLFSISAFFAAHANDYILCAMLMLLTNTSILHHANGTNDAAYFGGYIIGFIDRSLAHIITLWCLWDTIYMTFLDSAIVWTCVVYIGGCYYFVIRKRNIGTYKKDIFYPYHASIHVVSNFAVLWGLYVKSRYKFIN